MFKKISAVLLALVMVFCALPMASAASKDVIPVVLVSGFGATTLAQNGEAVFPPSMDKITGALGIKELTPESISALIERFTADGGAVAELSNLVLEIMEPVKMNPDGTPYYDDVVPIISGAENTSYKAFKEQDMLDYVPYTGSKFLDMEMIGDVIGDENVFNFMYDWRLDYDQTADELKAYIDDVLEMTGAKQVSIYTISQGGLVVGQYLYKYAHLGQAHNVVFDTPVLGGTTFATDLFIADPLEIKLDYVLAIVMDVMHTEMNLASLASLLDGVEIIPEAINYARNDLILPAIYSCPAFLQMVPISDFEAVKAVHLDETVNAGAIEKVERFQNGFMTHITKTFERAEQFGTTVSIKASTGFALCTNTDVYSDMIVDMQYSCGAICAPFGETFPEDYVQAVDTGKNHISPDRTVDISAGYWPDRTWVLNGLTHGAPEWCEASLALLVDLLLTDNVKDAYSHYEHPQFFESAAPTAKIKVTFENTNSNFLYTEELGEQSVLTVKNTSKKDTFIVRNIESATGAVEINYDLVEILGPGQTAYIPVVANELNSDTVTVTYTLVEEPLQSMTKEFGVTVTDSYSGAVKKDLTAETPIIDLIQKFDLKAFIFKMVIRIVGTVLSRIGFDLNSFISNGLDLGGLEDIISGIIF